MVNTFVLLHNPSLDLIWVWLKVQRRVQVKCDIVKEDSCLAFTVLSPKDKAIIVSFR